MRKFIGRRNYLKRLDNLWLKNEASVVSIYGRRRVGKTELIKVFTKNKKSWLFEALEGEDTVSQIKHFLKQLGDFTNEPYLQHLEYKDWTPVFELLSQKIEAQKEIIIAFDELPWMAARHSKLVSIIKFFWDKRWKYHRHLMLILCGSIASWMVQKVVKSKALYGRVSENILLTPLTPFEVAEFIGGRRGTSEILEYLLIFGGIPKYLEEMDFNRSIQVNIDSTCFQPSGFFSDEGEKIFYNLFKETEIYKQLVRLAERPLLLKDVAKKLKMQSGGGLKLYLENLIYAGIMEEISDIRDFRLTKKRRYYMIDEFLRFDRQFISPNKTEISHAQGKPLFEKLTKSKWHPFMGYAFERFCLKNRYLIADVLEFGLKVIACGPVLDNSENGFQYDIVYLRTDNVITLCEVKYLSERPKTNLIKEMEMKLEKTIFPKGVTIERILICNQEASIELSESGYFHRILHSNEIVFYQGG